MPSALHGGCGYYVMKLLVVSMPQRATVSVETDDEQSMAVPVAAGEEGVTTITYTVFHKKEPLILHYNSQIFLVDFYNSSTNGNRNEYSTITCNHVICLLNCLMTS